jgi:hypothetical protein
MFSDIMKSFLSHRGFHMNSICIILSISPLLLLFSASASSQNPNTDWFSKAGCGVFVHYLESMQNNPEEVHSLGKRTSWDECVRDFDVDQFADSMKEAGAGYVMFTVMQVSRFMIAPNATFDKISGYQPGEACATRDLIEDLYQALSKRGIPLMLYFTGDGPRADAKAGPAFNCGTPVTTDFVQKWADVFREYGERYGDKIAGVWCDGSYPFIGYDEEKLRILANGLRAGSSKRIIALNRGVDPKVLSYTHSEDYTTGEQNKFSDMPVERFVDGEQWHILSFLSGTWWGRPGVGYTKTELSQYVYDVNSRGGVVSIDIALFRDGSTDRSQIEMLKAVRKELTEGKNRVPIPPGNLAYRKQSKFLSLDGSHELVVNGMTHFPRLGVDGKTDTVALAANEWPWTYEVDLVDTKPIQRVKVTFGSGYATKFEIRLSSDGQSWQTVASKDEHDGSIFEATFASTSARYVRVCGIKPDGENQTGSQMSIAELETYE